LFAVGVFVLFVASNSLCFLSVSALCWCSCCPDSVAVVVIPLSWATGATETRTIYGKLLQVKWHPFVKSCNTFKEFLPSIYPSPFTSSCFVIVVAIQTPYKVTFHISTTPPCSLIPSTPFCPLVFAMASLEMHDNVVLPPFTRLATPHSP